MKKAIFFFIFSAIAFSSFSQQGNPAPALTKQDYLQKSKKQKTLARILFWGGGTLGCIGLSQLNLAGDVEGEVNNGPGAVMFLTGTAAVIASIPFFIAAKKNKKKAASIGFKMEKTPALQQQTFVYHSYPTLSFKISLQ